MSARFKNVRFLILSDTHGHDFFNDDDGQQDPRWSPADMPEADVVLHCGDLTNMGSIPDHVAALTMLSTFPAELKLVIAGNHDISLDSKASEQSTEMQQLHAKAVRLWTGKKARESGIVYLEEGSHAFTLESGVTFRVYASPYTPEFNAWAFGYPHDEDRFAAIGYPEIVMTHGPPFGHLDFASGKHLGCPHLMKAIARVKPRLHCFGHIHEGASAQFLDWDEDEFVVGEMFAQPQTLSRLAETGGDEGARTLMVNASMVDRANRPCHSRPWLVTMELPTS